MPTDVLLETGFLIALNPRDRNHKWALKILKKAGEGGLNIYLSPAALTQIALILKSRDLNDSDISVALEAMEHAIKRYTKPQYPVITPSHHAYAAKLRVKYRELTFFDSLHAATAILNNLIYHDLDDIVRKVISREKTT